MICGVSRIRRWFLGPPGGNPAEAFRRVRRNGVFWSSAIVAVGAYFLSIGRTAFGVVLILLGAYGIYYNARTFSRLIRQAEEGRKATPEERAAARARTRKLAPWYAAEMIALWALLGFLVGGLAVAAVMALSAVLFVGWFVWLVRRRVKP